MLEPGTKIDSCEIIKPLSGNDIYQSYLVNCLNAPAAKLLLFHIEQVLEPIKNQPFLEQARWLSSQTFAGIGLPYRAGEHDHQLYCLFPLFNGPSLAESLDRPVDVRSAVELVKEVAGYLIAPHSAGLVHGNLSPETICLDGQHPFLADFSLSQLVKLDYQSGRDPRYISPEQVRGDVIKSAADIYSLGCVFYHMLTGKAPYSGGDAFAIAMQHVQGDFPSLPDSLSKCQWLLDAMTKTTADERFSAERLLQECENLLTDKDLELTCYPVDSETEVNDQLSAAQQGHEQITEGDVDLASRIESRLKEHASNMSNDIMPESVKGQNSDATEGLEQIYSKDESRTWRYLLILFIGIAIGSGWYFLFFNQPASPEVKNDPIVKNSLNEDLDQALVSWKNADLTGAEREFKRLIDQYSDDPRAYNNLAAVYAAKGDYEQAREYLEQALSTSRDYATIYNNLGAVYAEMARDSYGKALQLDKTESLLNLQALSSQGVVMVELVSEEKPALSVATTAEENSASDLAGQDVKALSDEQDTVSLAVEPQIVMSTETFVDGVNEMTSQPSEVPSPEPAIESVPADEDALETAPEAPQKETAAEFILRWAQAWSQQDVSQYLTFYDQAFIPSGGKSKEDWETQRYERINRPQSIEVTLTDIQLSEQTEDRVRLEAVQTYNSDIYSDRTRKVFDLREGEEGWSILRERSLGSVL